MKETRAERQARELRISPLWARNAGAPGSRDSDGEQRKEVINMDEKQKAELQARNQQLEEQIAELSAKKDEVSKAKLEATQSELNELRAKTRIAEQEAQIAELQAEKAKRTELEAQAEVDRLVSLGVIPPMDKELKASHFEQFKANPQMIALSIKTHTKREGNVAPVRAASREGISVYGASDLTSALRTIAEISARSGASRDINPMKFSAANEIGAIYKREIQPLFAKGVTSLPLEATLASDSLGTLSGTLVALRTLDLYKYEFPMLDSISADFSDQPAQFNQTTSTRIIVVPAVLSYSGTIGGDGRPAGYSIATPAQTVDANVTLSNHRAVDIMFDANTLASTQRRLFEEQGPAAAYALGKDVVDALYAVITYANFGGNSGDNAPFAVASINYGRPTFAKAARVLNKQGAPFTNRFALSNSDYQEMLTQDPTLVSLAVFQKPEIITDSELPPISKFRPIEAPNLPATAITGFGNLAAFFAHKSALLIQARIPNDWSSVLGAGASYGSVNVVTNPDTGLSVLMVQFSNPQSAHAEFRLALMYGVAKGNSKGGQIVTT